MLESGINPLIFGCYHLACTVKALTAQRAKRKESVWQQTNAYALGTEDRMDMRLGHTRGACDSENPVLIIVNVRWM